MDFPYSAVPVSDRSERSVRFDVSGLPDITPDQSFLRSTVLRPEVLTLVYSKQTAGSPWEAVSVRIRGHRVLRNGRMSESTHAVDYSIERGATTIWPEFGPSWVLEFAREHADPDAL